MPRATRLRPLTLPAATFGAVLGAAFFVLSGCSYSNDAAKLTRELLTMPKEEAYARGEALVKKKKYEAGRQYLRFVAENYANDPIGRQAALRLADSYFDEKTQLGYLEAYVRYKDFRNRYPSHPKSDYALFRLAQCSDKQAEGPDREQTHTRQAATSYRELIINYPDSPYATEARARLGVMRNLLAQHEYLVGHFYLKRKAWRAGRGRMEFILQAYPDYTKLDQVLYEAGLLEGKMGNYDEERALWQRLRKDYPESPLVKKLPAQRVPAPAPVPAPVPAPGG